MATSPVTINGRNWLRTATLVISDQSVGIDLSNLRFRFEIRASDVETPNTAVIRVYNVADSTANEIWNSATYVTLTAGYQQGNQGTIFQGTIKQIRRGRERNTDNYLDVYAADGDLAYNQSLINQAFPAGTTDEQCLSALAAAMNIPSDPSNNGFLTTGGIRPSVRGKTFFGMARVFMRDLAQKNDCRWSIQNGVLTLVPNMGYLLPNQAVVISSASGMIGTPEQTEDGIMVQCYLNPLIKIGQAVQINNAEINRSARSGPIMFPSYTSQYYPATVTNDGLYRVLVHEIVGDTRGQEWRSELTCLAIDPSSPANTSVLAAG